MSGASNHQRPILIQYDANMVLPLEFVQELNQAYLLHLLARNPEKILPPGKSLISIITQEKIGYNAGENQSRETTVQEQVAGAMHAAFWDATAEKLSSSEPSEQNMHIRRLHNDIREAISALFPPEHELLNFLSLPPAPSTSPLDSFANTLKAVLVAFRKRCAPARDVEIDEELRKLESPPLKDTSRPQGPDPPPPQGEKVVNASPLAKFVIQSLKNILTIADHLKSDLHDYVLGSMTEEQLRALVIREAKAREQDLVIKLWSFHSQDTERGEDSIREQWRRWCEQSEEGSTAPPGDKWKSRLVKALFSPVSVSCAPPQNIANPKSSDRLSDDNRLPPQFLFTDRSLYRLQDYLQAIVITAALCPLVRSPPPSSLPLAGPTHTVPQSFSQRIWTLLQTELDSPGGGQTDNINPLKLVNLADEVVSACRLGATLDPSEEQRLREAVERILRPSDPVFSLLQRRLMGSLLDGIISKEASDHKSQMPDKLKTGRNHHNERIETSPTVVIGDFLVGTWTTPLPSIVGLIHPIRGFEDPVLSKAINEAFEELVETVRWTESVWGDFV